MFKGLALLAAGDAVVSIRRKAIAYVLFAVAGLIAMFAIGYALSALHIWLSINYSPIKASLFIAAGLLVVAITVAIAGMVQAKAKPQSATTAATLGTAAMVAAAPVAVRAATSPAGIGAIATLGVVALGAMVGRRLVK